MDPADGIGKKLRPPPLARFFGSFILRTGLYLFASSDCGEEADGERTVFKNCHLITPKWRFHPSLVRSLSAYTYSCAHKFVCLPAPLTRDRFIYFLALVMKMSETRCLGLLRAKYTKLFSHHVSRTGIGGNCERLGCFFLFPFATRSYFLLLLSQKRQKS